ncbi:MAG: LON peptidase substrate-binding domain-containing protein [Myxococcota bacterium]
MSDSPHAKKVLRLVEDELEHLPIFPLQSVVLLPQNLLPLHIFEPRYRSMTEAALRSDLPIAMTLLAPGQTDALGRPRVHAFAGVGKILQHERLPDGRFNIMLFGLARVRIEEELDVSTAYRQVRAVFEHSRVEDRQLLDVLMRSVQTLTLAIRKIEPKVATELVRMSDESSEPDAVVDRLAGLFFPDYRQRQRLLEEKVVERRLSVVVDRMAQYLAQLRIERGASESVLN